MTELADFRDLLIGFETQNSAQIELRVSLIWRDGVPDVAIAGIVHPKGDLLGVAPPLASVSVRCSAMNLRHWGAALTHALYALDFQLAFNELVEAEPKKA